MREILLASHVYLAKGMLSSLELIMGKQENIDILCAYTDDQYDIKAEIYKKLELLVANRADKYAEQGDIKGVSRMHWFGGIFGMYLPMAILVAVAYYLGSGVMETVLNAIPQFVQDGLTISAGILPALGFAILLRMILNKKIGSVMNR